MSKQHKNYIGSEEERFMKALSVCRTCKHVRMTHSIVQNGKCVDARVDAKGTWHTCKCKEFVPKDNLEYLEWRYETKKDKK